MGLLPVVVCGACEAILQPKCPWYPSCICFTPRNWAFTGPGCGATRCVYALLHGRWLEAAHQNLFVDDLSSAAGFVLLENSGGSGCAVFPAVPSEAPKMWKVWTLILSIFFFGIFRNLPSGLRF